MTSYYLSGKKHNTYLSGVIRKFILMSHVGIFSSVNHSLSTMKVLLVAIAFFALVSQIYGFKVLGVLPFFSKSHFAIGNSILKSLHEAGHELTVISPFPLKKPLANYRDIDCTEIMEEQTKAG